MCIRDRFVTEALALPDDVEVLVRGSQDHLSDEDLRALTDNVSLEVFADQLSDGTQVYLEKEDVVANMRVADAWLREQGCLATIVFCSNDYSELSDIPNVVLPSKLIINNTLAVVPKGATIGVLNPIEAVMDYEIQKWHYLNDEGYTIINTNAAPVIPESPDFAMMSEEEIATAETRPVEAALELVEQGADVIVLDCMGFSAKNRLEVFEATGKPVLDPQGLSSRALTLLYGMA